MCIYIVYIYTYIIYIYIIYVYIYYIYIIYIYIIYIYVFIYIFYKFLSKRNKIKCIQITISCSPRWNKCIIALIRNAAVYYIRAFPAGSPRSLDETSVKSVGWMWDIRTTESRADTRLVRISCRADASGACGSPRWEELVRTPSHASFLI